MHGQAQDFFFLRTLGVRRLHISSGEGRLGYLQSVPACGYFPSYGRFEPQCDAVSRQGSHGVCSGDDVRRFGETREAVSAVRVGDRYVCAEGVGVVVGELKRKVSRTISIHNFTHGTDHDLFSSSHGLLNRSSASYVVRGCDTLCRSGIIQDSCHTDRTRQS